MHRGSELLERLRQEVLVFDGAMGTMLFAAGLDGGACPELWNETHLDIVRGIHKAYFDAGSDFVETNTFGGTRLKLKAYGLQEKTVDLNVRGVRLAREVCPPEGFVAGSIGPTGHLVEPYGDATADEIAENFREQVLALAEGGVDLFAIETMMYPEEAILAIKAAKAYTDLPIMATMTFDVDANGYRTMWGTSPQEAARLLTEAGADVVGCNCVNGPEVAAGVLQEMRPVTSAFLIAYPNAGLPVLERGRSVFRMGPEEMIQGYPPILEAGGRVVGGCCGTTPQHIARIAELVKRWRKAPQ